MPDHPTDQLRAICLALPQATEKQAWGNPTYRVREKIFAMEKRCDGRVSVWCKAPEGSQAVLVGADPDRFFAPPYVGPKGWVGMRLDHEPDWSEVATLVRRSYRLIAPKRLVTLVA
jgi:predicted DNA-binding protein (MmcQ/YjbR family)